MEDGNQATQEIGKVIAFGAFLAKVEMKGSSRKGENPQDKQR